MFATLILLTANQDRWILLRILLEFFQVTSSNNIVADLDCAPTCLDLRPFQPCSNAGAGPRRFCHPGSRRGPSSHLTSSPCLTPSLLACLSRCFVWCSTRPLGAERRCSLARHHAQHHHLFSPSVEEQHMLLYASAIAVSAQRLCITPHVMYTPNTRLHAALPAAGSSTANSGPSRRFTGCCSDSSFGPRATAPMSQSST